MGVRAVYGFLAPTGRFEAGASDNVGSGYWTHAPAAGHGLSHERQNDHALRVSHVRVPHRSRKARTSIPGQTVNLDYSVARTIRLSEDTLLQLGLVGYGQRQTTDKTGPAITAAAGARITRSTRWGSRPTSMLPARKVSLGLKYFKEFSNRSTFQGYTLQISGAVTF